MKKCKSNLLYILYLVFVTISVVALCYHSVSFELGWNEALEIYQIHKHSILDYLNPEKIDYAISDRGFIYPIILKLFAPFFENNYWKYRFISIFFYVTSCILVLTVNTKEFSLKERVLASILCMTSIVYVQYGTVINPYSLNLLFVVLLYQHHFSFKNSKWSYLYHSFLCAINISIFFNSLIPVALSIFYIAKGNLKLFFRNAWMYLPFAIILIIEGYQVFWYRLLVRVDEPFFNTENNLLDSLAHMIRIYDVDLSIINYLGSMQWLYLPVIGISLAAIVYVHFKIIENRRKQSFLFFYIIFSYLTFGLLRYYGAAEIVCRYYLPMIPLFYLYLTKILMKFDKKIIFAITLSSLLISKGVVLVVTYKNNKDLPWITVIKNLPKSFDPKLNNICVIKPRRVTYFLKEILFTYPDKRFANKSVSYLKKIGDCSSGSLALAKKPIVYIAFGEKLNEFDVEQSKYRKNLLNISPIIIKPKGNYDEIIFMYILEKDEAI